MDNIELRGSGPFHLPVAQRAKIVHHDENGATLIFYVLNSENELVAVSMQLTESVAEQIVESLARS